MAQVNAIVHRTLHLAETRADVLVGVAYAKSRDLHAALEHSNIAEALVRNRAVATSKAIAGVSPGGPLSRGCGDMLNLLMVERFHDERRMRCRNCGKIRKPAEAKSCDCGRTAWVYDAPKDQTMPRFGMKGTRLGRRAPGSYGSGKRN